MINTNKKLPTDWEWVEIKEACTLIFGQSPPSSSYRKHPEGLPFFQGKADFGEIYPTARVWCASPKKEALPNDILLSIRAPVGPTNLTNAKCCIGRGLVALRADEKKLNSKFLLFYLRCTEKHVAQLGSGSTFSSITKKHISSYKIPLPPISEQKRIVAKLDKQLAAVEQARNNAEQLLSAAEVNLLYIALQRETILGGNYPQVELGSILDYEQPTSYIVQSTKYSNDYSIPVLTAGKTFLLGYTNEETGIFPSKNLPVIIFDDFTTAIKYVDFPFKVKSSAMKILKAKDHSKSDIKYVHMAMSLIKFDATTHKRYWISEYSKIKIPLPPLPEQKRIIAQLSSQLVAVERAQQDIERQWLELNLLPNALLRESLLP